MSNLLRQLQVFTIKEKKKEEEPESLVVQSNTQNLDVSELSDQLSQLSQPSSTQSSGSDSSFHLTIRPSNEKEVIELPYKRTISTHKYCFLCKNTKNIIVVPFEARKQVFVAKNIVIPQGNRCCKDHLIKNRFFDEEIVKINVASNTSSFELHDLTKLLSSLSVSCDKKIIDHMGDFSLPEDRLRVFTGLSWENIIELREMMTSLRNSSNRNVSQALIVFLTKLRSGNSNELIAAILGLDEPRKISSFTVSILQAFEKDVLPTRFGLQAMKRVDLINNHMTSVVKKLHKTENHLVLIADGTYVRHQKSSNNEYQRKSYSGQKKVPLCKPFTICTPDGYVVDVLGPYYANKNDAQILRELLDENTDLQNLLQPQDVFVLDRGFRDVVDYLEELQYRVLMPSLKGTKKQLSAAESNYSRRVTAVRWVIEATHGIIGQKFKLLHHQLDNRLILNVEHYCKAACFLVNHFGKRLESTISANEEILSRFETQNLDENTLAIESQSNRWSRRKTLFSSLGSEDVLDFPELTENDLKIFFTGTYQMQQAISYLAEMLDENNEVRLQYLKESKDIIKVQVRSRHINSKTYNCYIHYKPNSIGYKSILRYCCECANGLRTIGSCSHVAAVVYYLSHARYISKKLRPAEKLTKIFETTGVEPIINEDSDED